MKNKAQKRRKGGGRKLADGKITEVRLTRLASEWFQQETSVDHFLQKVQISRQTYYRFLNRHPTLKTWISDSREKNIQAKKVRIKNILSFYNTNLEKNYLDFVLKDIGKIGLPKIVTQGVKIVNF